MAKNSDPTGGDKTKRAVAGKATRQQTATAKKAATSKTAVKKAAVKKKATAKKAAPKPAAAASKAVTKKVVAKKAAAKPARVRRISSVERHQMIAEAAYLRGESQGFAGDQQQDWLLAEAEVDALLAKAGVRVAD